MTTRPRLLTLAGGAALLAVALSCGCGPSKEDLARLLDENAALRKKLALPNETAITPAPMSVVTAPPTAATCTPLEPPADPVPLGKPVETRSYRITATAATACAPPDEQGKILYGVELLIEARDTSVFVGSAQIEDDKSYHYGGVIPFQEACGPRLNDISLGKGEKSRGYVHFVVPAAAQGKVLQLSVRAGSNSLKLHTLKVKLDR